MEIKTNKLKLIDFRQLLCYVISLLFIILLGLNHYFCSPGPLFPFVNHYL